MQIDFGRAAEDYRRHRAGFPKCFYEELAMRGIGQPKQRILDLGTGTGTIARSLATQGADVTGIDLSPAMLAQAAVMDKEANVTVTYRCASAEATEFGDASFDVITAGQCWHWFNPQLAIEEVMRLLRPQGKLVIAHFDWLPLGRNVVSATEQLILRHNPRWQMSGGNGTYPQWVDLLSQHKFRSLETFQFDVDVTYSHEAWRGRIRASAGIKASLDEEAVTHFDKKHAAMLQTRFPDEPLAIPHRVWAVVGQRPT